MGKTALDGNLEKNLEELGKHPALLRRCQEFYLQRVINRATYEELSKQHGVALTTAWKYVQAYRKVADRYADDPSIQDTVAVCHSEIAYLLKVREEEAKTVQERQLLSKEIRNWQGMILEVTGLVDRRPKIQNTVMQVVNIVDDSMREALQEMGLSKEKAGEILRLAAEKIREAVRKEEERTSQKVLEN